jgi:hypothetical protein
MKVDLTNVVAGQPPHPQARGIAPHPTMGSWRKRKILKKGRGKSESGKSKGLVPDALAKYMCRRNRSYKHPLYDEVMSKLAIKKNKK